MIAVLYLKGDDREQNAVAIVQCAEHSTIMSLDDMRKRLRIAVTQWMLGTKEGMEAWTDAKEAFNVGHLAYHVSDGSEAGDGDKTKPNLLPYLEKLNLFNLTIQIYRGERGWQFNDSLCDERAVRATKAAGEPPADSPV